MRKLFFLPLLLTSLLSFSQNVDFKVNSSCLSDNTINYIVGLTHVQLTYPPAKTKEIIEKPSFYPNPVTDILYFLDYEKEMIVEVYNELGQLIIKKQIFNNYIDLSGLKKGLYLIIPKTKDAKPFKILKT